MSIIKRDDSMALVRSAEPMYGYGGLDPSPETEDVFMDYWRVLWRRKWIVFLFAFICGSGGLTFAILSKPVYSAHTTLEVQDVVPSANSVTLTAPDNQVFSALSDIQTQVRILQSETLAARTLEKLEKTGWRNVPGRKVVNPDDKPDTGLADPETVLLVSAARSAKVREVGATRIIEIVVDSTDRFLAASYANTAVDEFIDQNMEARWKMSKRTGDWLSRELNDTRVKLERSEYDLQAYAQKVGLLFTNTGNNADARANVSGQKLLELQTALSTASTERVSKQSKFSIADGGKAEGIPDVLNDPTLREYQTRLADLRRQIAELSAVYTPDFTKIKRLQGQLESIQTTFDRQRAAVVDKIKNEYDEALMRERLLASDFQSQAKTVTLEGEKAIQYNLLKREVDTNRQLYETMLQRVKESGVNAALKASNIRVVDSALVPSFPSRPNKPLDVAMGLFLGTLAGMAFVVFRDKSDATFRIPGDSPRWLYVPELGVIPKGDIRVSMRAPVAPLSLGASSSITAVLTSIMFSSQNGIMPRILVFTSANPAEGKTTVASNIALKCSQVGKNVLLIDADFARPRLHEIFGLPNTHGLSTVIQTPHLSEQDYRSHIYEVLPGLSVLTSGPAILDTSDLLFANHIPEILGRLKAMFETIVIDTPPTPQFVHARVLGRMADGIVLVMRSGRTSRETALATIQRLNADHSHVLGTVLNDWNPKTSPAKYYGNRGNGRYLRLPPPIDPMEVSAS